MAVGAGLLAWQLAAASVRLAWPEADFALALVVLWQAAVARTFDVSARAVAAGVEEAADGTVLRFVPAPFARSIGKLLPQAERRRLPLPCQDGVDENGRDMPLE